VPKNIRPGKYKIKFKIEDDSGDALKVFEISKDFSWGVLAMNFNQASYTLGQTAKIQVAVLDERGDTICDAGLILDIISPSGQIFNLSSASSTIFTSGACGANNITDAPDYFALFTPAETGKYSVNLTAETKNGFYAITDGFAVLENMDFMVERTGPTRIYPWADYIMSFNIKINKNFSGDIFEYLPNGFQVFGQGLQIKNQETGEFVDYNEFIASTSRPAEFSVENTEDKKIPKWKNLNLKAGDEIAVRYTFDAPNISPELYLLGALRLVSADGTVEFTEGRQWQIAADSDVGALSANAIAITAGTTDTSNWTTVVSIPNTSFIGGHKYFIYVSGGFAGSTNAVRTDFQISYNTSAQFTGLIEAGQGVAYAAYPINWFDVYDQPSTPNDVILEYRTDIGASYALNAQIMAIDLTDLQTADWEYGINTTLAQHTTSLTSKASITLSDANGVDDWLVLAMEELLIDSVTVNYEGQIFNGTTGYMTQSREGEDSLEILSYVIYRPFDNVATNTVFSMRVRDDATGINDHLKSRIFALNLDAFESHKTYYSNTSVPMGAWTEVGNLNSGGNYAPQTTGDQIIFSSFINNRGVQGDGANDRLQVNGVTTPIGWSWVQSPVPYYNAFDATDQTAHNIVSKISIPSTGQTIDMDADEVNGTSQAADEISMTVFSVKKKNRYKPTGSFNSAAQRKDGTGTVDISVEANDLDYDPSRAKLEFATGTSCVFSPSGDPTIDTLDANTTADTGDPDIDNNHAYQIGTSTNYIITTSGSNTVDFDWFSKTDLPIGDGTYCLRLTVNDGDYDQLIPATTTLVIDNTLPTAPGALSLNKRTGTSITLNFGATTTETNFNEYKIFYKVYDGTAPGEGDSVFASTSDADLGNKIFNNTSTTTISSLTAGNIYSFAIWAYDSYGNKASSSRVDIIANDAPTGSFNLGDTGQKTDGSGIVDISIEVDDNNSNNSRAKLEYVEGADCNFSPALDPNFDAGSIASDYGSVAIDNNYEYQIGTTSYWITTPSSNTVTFDWPSKAQESSADGVYCLRLTVIFPHCIGVVGSKISSPCVLVSYSLTVFIFSVVIFDAVASRVSMSIGSFPSAK